jgi:TonB-linked SusC/RagA family outer membrane protein
MKKFCNHLKGDEKHFSWFEILTAMKLTLILTLFLIAQSFAVQTYSQGTTLNLNLKDVSVRKVLQEIEDRTEFYFLYNDDFVNVSRIVNIDVREAKIQDVLKQLFRDGEITYIIRGRQIILSPLEIDSDHSIANQQVIKKVSGKVTSITKEPIPGVTVLVKGTKIGTITDSDGAYSLSGVPADATLIFSFVGMRTREVTVGKSNEIDISLEEDVQGVEEVVVIGYGTQKKVNLTGSVASVDVSKITESRPITNISTGLAGVAPGLYVKSSSNDPGSNASLLIRGQGTLNNASPLVIIDGVEGNIGNISPQDITAISVLKDAASASIYGSRAANGVILITTKQGEAGKIHINYDGYASIQSVAYDMSFVSNSVRYMELQNEAARNSGLVANFSEENIQLWKEHEGEDPLLWPNMDWQDAMFRTTHTMNHNISAQGGTDRVKTFISLNMSDTPGIIENTGYKKTGIRSNTQLQVTSWLNVGMNLNGFYSDKEPGSTALSGMFSNAMASIPTIVNRSPDGRYGGTNNFEDVQTVASPLWYVNQYKGDNKTRAFSSKFYTDLSPVEGLNIHAAYYYDFSDNKTTLRPTQNDRWNFQTNTVIVSGKTSLYISNTDTRSSRNFMDAHVSYERKLFSNLSFKLMAGGSQEKYSTENFSATKYNLIDENLTQINAATGEADATGTLSDWSMQSFFGRMNLSYNDKYLLELNFRRDGSSRFTSDNRWGNFSSVSAGWRISEESFMRSLRDTWLNNLKIRASYGSLGNNAVGNYDAISVLTSTAYALNNIPAVGFYQSAISNANLKWESTYVTNLGLDFGLFDKLSGNIDVYNKLTKNILINLPAPLAVGTASTPPQNSAEVRNRGIELILSWQDRIKDVNYFIQGNFTYNSNKVVKYKGDDYSLSGTYMIKEGLPINTQYVRIADRIVQTQGDLDLVQQYIDKARSGVNPFPNGKPQMGDFLYKDLTGEGIVSNDDRTTVGHGQNPRFMYGLSFGANYKGFDFACQIDGIGGLKTYFQNDYYTPNLRQSNVISKDIADGRWYEGRTTKATFPRLLQGDTRNTAPSDFWIADNSYLKIRNIQVGYMIPSQLLTPLTISRLRIYTQLENFFTFTDYPGLDPELTSMTYPTMKQVVFGINLSF